MNVEDQVWNSLEPKMAKKKKRKHLVEKGSGQEVKLKKRKTDMLEEDIAPTDAVPNEKAIKKKKKKKKERREEGKGSDDPQSIFVQKVKKKKEEICLKNDVVRSKKKKKSKKKMLDLVAKDVSLLDALNVKKKKRKFEADLVLSESVTDLGEDGNPDFDQSRVRPSVKRKKKKVKLDEGKQANLSEETNELEGENKVSESDVESNDEDDEDERLNDDELQSMVDEALGLREDGGIEGTLVDVERDDDDDDSESLSFSDEDGNLKSQMEAAAKLKSWKSVKGKPLTKKNSLLASAKLKIASYLDPVYVNMKGKLVTNDGKRGEPETAVWAKRNRGYNAQLINYVGKRYQNEDPLSEEEIVEFFDYVFDHRESVGQNPFHISSCIHTSFWAFVTKPAFLKELRKRGQDLRLSKFLPSEDKILTENFELFLRERDMSLDEEGMADLIFNPDNVRFRRKTGLLVFAAFGLHRHTTHVYRRLHDLYHTYIRGRFTAEEKQRVIDLYTSFKEKGKQITRGHHGEFIQLGRKMQRNNRHLVKIHYDYKVWDLGHSMELTKSDGEQLFGAMRAVSGVEDLTSVSDFDWDEVAKRVMPENPTKWRRTSPERMASNWVRFWRRLYQMRVLGEWTRLDNLLLLAKMEEQQKDCPNADEYNLDWEDIKLSFPNVLDVRQLREKWTYMRRKVPYYMIKDLRSSLAYLKEHYSKKED